jgi:hypothetical protein
MMTLRFRLNFGPSVYNTNISLFSYTFNNTSDFQQTLPYLFK